MRGTSHTRVTLQLQPCVRVPTTSFRSKHWTAETSYVHTSHSAKHRSILAISLGCDSNPMWQSIRTTILEGHAILVNADRPTAGDTGVFHTQAGLRMKGPMHTMLPSTSWGTRSDRVNACVSCALLLISSLPVLSWVLRDGWSKEDHARVAAGVSCHAIVASNQPPGVDYCQVSVVHEHWFVSAKASAHEIDDGLHTKLSLLPRFHACFSSRVFPPTRQS